MKMRTMLKEARIVRIDPAKGAAAAAAAAGSSSSSNAGVRRGVYDEV